VDASWRSFAESHNTRGIGQFAVLQFPPAPSLGELDPELESASETAPEIEGGRRPWIRALPRNCRSHRAGGARVDGASRDLISRFAAPDRRCRRSYPGSYFVSAGGPSIS